MKRVDLIRAVDAAGWQLIRHGGKHDWYRNPTTGALQPVPRHREIKDHLAGRIIKILSDPGTVGTEQKVQVSPHSPR